MQHLAKSAGELVRVTYLQIGVEDRDGDIPEARSATVTVTQDALDHIDDPVGPHGMSMHLNAARDGLRDTPRVLTGQLSVTAATQTE